MGVSTDALRTLAVSGFAIGCLYALTLILAFRYGGRTGGAIFATMALAGWTVVLVTDSSGRFHDAPWSLRVAMAVLLAALSVLPALVIDRVRRQAGASFTRQVVFGLASFFIAILGSLVIGVPIVVAGMTGGW